MRQLSVVERIALAVICTVAALAAFAHYAGWTPVAAFVVATLALA